jgi:hypothetical protein
MTLALRPTWQRTRAILLHDHFKGIATRLEFNNGRGTKLTGPDGEIARMARLLKGKILSRAGEPEKTLDASEGTLRREWARWNKGGRTSESLLLNYKPGVGGHKAMPEPLVMEIQRRATLPFGARDKNKKAPLSVVMQSICEDFSARRHLPGVDYSQFPVGAEFPWSYRTVVRKKPAKALRLMGNVGGSAAKAASAYVSMNYTRLRKGEMYTLDDVRLDILCIDERTGKPIRVVCYILMEVGSRALVAYIMKPAASIRQEDVDELLALGLQTRGFGIGVGYKTHILFEQGTVACSEATQQCLETMTASDDGSGIEVRRTGMIKNIRWIGSPADKAKGNACGKGVIESFNRWLHFALLNLPGQRGNNWANAPENLGYEGPDNFTPGSLAAETKKLAEFRIEAGKHGQRTDLKLGMLYFMQLHAAVREAIHRHNTETGHAYRGHGSHFEAEIQPGVWQRQDDPAAPVALPPARNIHFEEMESSLPIAPSPRASAPQRAMKLQAPAVELNFKQRNALYWSAWNKLKRAAAATGEPVNDDFRFALTRRVLGKVTPIKKMEPEDLRKVLSCFDQVTAKYAKAPAQPF